jgi:hypothetical protein
LILFLDGAVADVHFLSFDERPDDAAAVEGLDILR